MQRHIGQEIEPKISHHIGVYTLEYVRDFVWETEYAAKQHFLTVNIRQQDIVGCRLYKSTFGLLQLAHYMVGFLYIDEQHIEREIIFSIEARRPIGDAYALWKGILPGMYDMMYTRGTPDDMIGLRKNIWHEPVESFSMCLSAEQCHALFIYFVHKTNMPARVSKWYSAFSHNCVTDIHRGLYTVTKKITRFSIWAILSPGYNGYLHRHGIL